MLSTTKRIISAAVLACTAAAAAADEVTVRIVEPVTLRTDGTPIANPVSYRYYHNSALIIETAERQADVGVESRLNQTFCVSAKEGALEGEAACVTTPGALPESVRITIEFTL